MVQELGQIGLDDAPDDRRVKDILAVSDDVSESDNSVGSLNPVGEGGVNVP